MSLRTPSLITTGLNMRRARRLTMVAIVGFLGACAGWSRVPVMTSAVPAFQQVQVWTSDSTLVLHAVSVGHDSLTGVPLDDPGDCARCRVAISMAQVDSIRVGKTTSIGPAVMGFVAGMMGALLLISLALSGG